jgi:hypothetical protein
VELALYWALEAEVEGRQPLDPASEAPSRAFLSPRPAPRVSQVRFSLPQQECCVCGCSEEVLWGSNAGNPRQMDGARLIQDAVWTTFLSLAPSPSVRAPIDTPLYRKMDKRRNDLFQARENTLFTRGGEAQALPSCS